MHALTLPAEGRRAFVRSFWLMLGALVLVPWFALVWWVGSPELVVAGVGNAAVIALPGFVNERFARRAYYAWNRRLVRPLGAVLARALMRICFLIVVLAGRAASSSAVLKDGVHGVTWMHRDALRQDAYRAPYAAAAPHAASGGWISGYVRWAWHTGNIWSVSLLPFLVMLKLLSRDDEDAPRPNIYTLF